MTLSKKKSDFIVIWLIIKKSFLQYYLNFVLLKERENITSLNKTCYTTEDQIVHEKQIISEDSRVATKDKKRPAKCKILKIPGYY